MTTADAIKEADVFMERWSKIASYYFLNTHYRYQCKCGLEFKTDTGAYRHAENKHYVRGFHP